MEIAWALADDEPSFQATNAGTERAPVASAELIAIHLRDDLHDAAVDRVALPGQLRQLLEQHLEALIGWCEDGHTVIVAAGYDKSSDLTARWATQSSGL